MNQTIEERVQSIEDQLKEIRKELEESLSRYKDSYKNPIHSWKDIQLGETKSNKCLYDNLPPEDRYKPMCMSCPCRKCSPYC